MGHKNLNNQQQTADCSANDSYTYSQFVFALLPTAATVMIDCCQSMGK